jgi:uncharacterized protein YciI
MRAAAIAVLCLVAASCTSPPKEEPMAPAPAADEGPPQVVYAVRHLPGPKWLAGKRPQEQPGIGEHIAHMQGWDEKKILVCGGPFLDGTGGLAVLRAASLEEAESLAKADPSVAAGLLVPEVHPWLLAADSEIAPRR